MDKIQYKNPSQSLPSTLASQCEIVLRSVPEWFGEEPALQMYLRKLPNLQTYSAWHNAEMVGFFSVAYHGKQSAELFVLAVNKSFHGQGIGSQLYRILEQDLIEKEVKFVQVKTLSPRVNDENYLKTMQFYLKHGFVELEDHDDFWGEQVHCLQMIKVI